MRLVLKFSRLAIVLQKFLVILWSRGVLLFPNVKLKKWVYIFSSFTKLILKQFKDYATKKLLKILQKSNCHYSFRVEYFHPRFLVSFASWWLTFFFMLLFTARQGKNCFLDNQAGTWDKVCDYVIMGQNIYGMPWQGNKTTNYENNILVWWIRNLINSEN